MFYDSQLRGEELNGLNFEELKQLEKLVQGGLHRVLRAKGDKIEKEMIALKRKVRHMVGIAGHNEIGAAGAALNVIKIRKCVELVPGREQEFILHSKI